MIAYVACGGGGHVSCFTFLFSLFTYIFGGGKLPIFNNFFAYLIWGSLPDLRKNGFFGILAIIKERDPKNIYIPSTV